MVINRRMLIFAFGMSMFSSLVYEVVWTRQLSLVFGTTVYALSAVLTSFMAGLAIGSFVFGRKADRTADPLRIFVKLEFILGAYGIVSIFLLGMLQVPYYFIYGYFGSSPLTAVSIFALAFVFLIIPTAVIGATFPIMSKIYTKEIGEDISDIYSVDTIAGGLGALLAGFVFLPYLGLIATAAIACVNNLIIGYLFRRGAA